jgi:hypothetical protein
MKLGWNSTIKLSYNRKQKLGRNEEIDEQFEKETSRKQELWYYKLDEKTIKNENEKVLTLNIVEVIVSYGYAIGEFEKTAMEKLMKQKAQN